MQGTSNSISENFDTDEIEESLENSQNMENSDQFHKNLTDDFEKKAKNSIEQEATKIKNRIESEPEPEPTIMENNGTKILSQAENQQSMKKTSSLVSRVSETPENIKPIENPQLEKGQVSELENFKETSSVSENQQHLTKIF